MPIIKYDYLGRPSLENSELIIIYRPIIPVRISNRNRIYPYTVNCFVDSGSDFNLMPADIAEKIKISVKKGEKVTHMGIGNVGIVAYSHPVTLYVEDYKIRTSVHFSFDHKIPLLGRYSFFKFFRRIIFNEKYLRLELEYINK